MCFVCVCTEINILNKVHLVAREKTPRFRKYLSFKYSYYQAEASDDHLAPVIFFLGS